MSETMKSTMAADAATLGLGFHRFDGNVPVDEIIRRIGADFSVRKEHLIRISDSEYQMLMSGQMAPMMVYPNRLIETHCATVNERDNSTIGVVGSDYGIIQNQQALDILNFIASPDNDNGIQIVSAGLVHEHEPYVQMTLPNDGLQINNDDSPTEFYAFVHTSHDGSSQLKVSFSAIRVVCQNTFMANMKSIGFGIRHSSRAEQRADMNKDENKKRVREFINQAEVFRTDYVERMNFYSEKTINSNYVDWFVNKLFVDDTKVAKDIEANNFHYRNMDEVSTRLKNQMDAFKEVLEIGAGQHSSRGTSLWLFNGLTNYYSNRQRYGSDKDDTRTRATKRFDSLNGGHAAKKIEQGMKLLEIA